jgi:hypothetical protein
MVPTLFGAGRDGEFWTTGEGADSNSIARMAVTPINAATEKTPIHIRTWLRDLRLAATSRAFAVFLPCRI